MQIEDVIKKMRELGPRYKGCAGRLEKILHTDGAWNPIDGFE